MILSLDTSKSLFLVIFDPKIIIFRPDLTKTTRVIEFLMDFEAFFGQKSVKNDNFRVFRHFLHGFLPKNESKSTRKPPFYNHKCTLIVSVAFGINFYHFFEHFWVIFVNFSGDKGLKTPLKSTLFEL